VEQAPNLLERDARKEYDLFRRNELLRDRQTELAELTVDLAP
jgi:hypothetical protein